jgi:hypothetical protein
MAEGKLRVSEVAGSNKTRFKNWVSEGIIPPDGEIPAPGGKAFVYPQWAGAVFAILCDLYDGGIVVGRRQLAAMWRYFAEPHGEGCHPHITHILDAVAKDEACWLILTLWRHPITGGFETTCCTRFEDQADKPIAGPTPDHQPFGEYIVSLHKLLERFASAESNVRPLKAVQ